jgi:hypothetical protein
MIVPEKVAFVVVITCWSGPGGATPDPEAANNRLNR